MKYLDFTNAHGRMSNHFYFALQAYIKSKFFKEDFKYLTNETFFQNNILLKMQKFNMDKYVKYDNIFNKNDEIIQDSSYYWWDFYHQQFNKDFTEDDLKNFISDTFLTTGYFKKNNNNDTVALHLRFGDYVNNKLFDCINKQEYITKCISLLPNNINNIKIFSDDLEMSKKLFLNIKTKLMIYYSNNKIDIDDFIELSCFKYKILFNSTFSYWTGFISNVLYKNNYTDIFAPAKFMSVGIDKSHVNPKWTII